MKKFLSSYAFIALAFFAFQAVGAFVIGTQTISRYQPNDDVSAEDLPTDALAGGFNAAASLLLPVTLGFLIRFFAYGRWDRNGVRSRVLYYVLIAAEAVYAIINLRIVWIYTEPVVDSGFAWLLLLQLALVVTVMSLILLMIAAAGKKRPQD